jgi:hypothetical protein
MALCMHPEVHVGDVNLSEDCREYLAGEKRISTELLVAYVRFPGSSETEKENLGS